MCCADHIETECSPCGGYYRDGKNEWVSKQTHDDPHVLETLSKADPQFGTYSEAQYGNRTQRWIRMMATTHPDTPWFAFIGTTGPHLPAIPAWWHAERTRSLPHTAPRTPNFNEHAGDHHALLATQPQLDAAAIAHVDGLFRARLGTLFSIDDMVAGLMQTLNETGLANNTFVMFTSDHGSVDAEGLGGDGDGGNGEGEWECYMYTSVHILFSTSLERVQ